MKLMLKDIDADQSGNIEFSEFVNWGALPEHVVLSRIEELEGVKAADIKKRG